MFPGLFGLGVQDVIGLPNMNAIRPSSPNSQSNAKNAIQDSLRQKDVVSSRDSAIEESVEVVQ